MSKFTVLSVLTVGAGVVLGLDVSFFDFALCALPYVASKLGEHKTT